MEVADGAKRSSLQQPLAVEKKFMGQTLGWHFSW